MRNNFETMILFITLLLLIFCHEAKANTSRNLLQSTSDVTVTYSEQEGGYVVITNVVVPGFISDILDDDFTDDRDECEAMCLENEECDFWSFDKNDKRCIIRKDEGKNFVYNTNYDSGIKKKGDETGTIYIDESLYDSSRENGPIFEGYGVKGEDLNTYSYSTWGVGEVGSSEECNLACLYESNCEAWSYSMSTSLCHLKSYDGEIEKDTDKTSGLILKEYSEEIEICKLDYHCRSIDEDLELCEAYTFCSIVDSEVPVTCEVNQNTQCYGNIQKFKKWKEGAEKCCEECRNDSYCFTWSFKKSNNQCFGYYDKVKCKSDDGFKGGSFI